MSENFLELMARSSRARVVRARRQCSEPLLRERARATPLPPPLTLSRLGFDLIAEVKLHSPSAGALSSASADIGMRVRAYADAGAAAISVLTEPTRFNGALEHLQRSAQILGARAPVMRKDFLLDPYQLYEARVSGAAGVLLILRMLAPDEQRALIELCGELGLFVLLESFDQQDLERASELTRRYRGRAALLVGVNCRDLSSLEVVPGRLQALAAHLPAGVPHVAESGVQSAAELAPLVRAGYDVALVGSALMRAHSPSELTRELLASGRAAARERAGSQPCR